MSWKGRGSGSGVSKFKVFFGFRGFRSICKVFKVFLVGFWGFKLSERGAFKFQGLGCFYGLARYRLVGWRVHSQGLGFEAFRTSPLGSRAVAFRP